MSDFDEWFAKWEEIQSDGRLSYDIRQGAEEAWDHQQQRIDELEQRIQQLESLIESCKSLTGSMWPQNETTEKLSEILEDSSDDV